MRATPIDYLCQHDPEKLKYVAHASGICTHGHQTADAARIGAAYLVKPALDKTDPAQLLSKLLAFTAGISDEFDQAVLKINQCLSWGDPHKALCFLGSGLLSVKLPAQTAPRDQLGRCKENLLRGSAKGVGRDCGNGHRHKMTPEQAKRAAVAKQKRYLGASRLLMHPAFRYFK